MNPLLMLMAVLPKEFGPESFKTFDIPTWAVVIFAILGVITIILFFILIYGVVYFNFIWEPGVQLPKLLTI